MIVRGTISARPILSGAYQNLIQIDLQNPPQRHSSCDKCANVGEMRSTNTVLVDQ